MEDLKFTSGTLMHSENIDTDITWVEGVSPQNLELTFPMIFNQVPKDQKSIYDLFKDNNISFERDKPRPFTFDFFLGRSIGKTDWMFGDWDERSSMDKKDLERLDTATIAKRLLRLQKDMDTTFGYSDFVVCEMALYPESISKEDYNKAIKLLISLKKNNVTLEV